MSTAPGGSRKVSFTCGWNGVGAKGPCDVVVFVLLLLSSSISSVSLSSISIDSVTDIDSLLDFLLLVSERRALRRGAFSLFTFSDGFWSLAGLMAKLLVGAFVFLESGSLVVVVVVCPICVFVTFPSTALASPVLKSFSFVVQLDPFEAMDLERAGAANERVFKCSIKELYNYLPEFEPLSLSLQLDRRGWLCLNICEGVAAQQAINK